MRQNLLPVRLHNGVSTREEDSLGKLRPARSGSRFLPPIQQRGDADHRDPDRLQEVDLAQGPRRGERTNPGRAERDEDDKHERPQNGAERQPPFVLRPPQKCPYRNADQAKRNEHCEVANDWDLFFPPQASEQRSRRMEKRGLKIELFVNGEKCQSHSQSEPPPPAHRISAAVTLDVPISPTQQGGGDVTRRDKPAQDRTIVEQRRNLSDGAGAGQRQNYAAAPNAPTNGALCRMIR